MFTSSTFLWWGIVSCFKLALVLVVCRRRDYPAFRAYAYATTAKTALLWLLALQKFSTAYFFTYYLGDAIETALLFLTVKELAMDLILPLDILPNPVLRAATYSGTFVGFSISASAFILRSSYPYQGYAIARTLDAAATGALLSLLAGLVVVARYLSIPWKERSVWLALGLGFYLSINLAYSLKFLHIHPRMQWVHSCAFLVSVVIWMIGLLTNPQEQHQPSAEEIRTVSLAVGKLETEFAKGKAA